VKKISYGWAVVGIGIVVTCFGMGAMLSLSVFLQPMAQAMGWSRTGVSTAATVNWLCMGVGAFLWGWLSDRYGSRVVVLIGGVLLGLGLVTASRSASLGQFQLLFGVLVGLASGSFYTPLTATTTRWFTENRSLAVALVSAGVGLGSTTVGPLARYLISAYDWRVAMFAIGNLSWLVIIPMALLVREPPATAVGAPGTLGAGGREMTAGQALRTPQFAAIALAYFACCAAHSGPIFHMVTHATDQGIPAMAAASVLGVSGLASIGGRIGGGLIADRLGVKRTLIGGLALQAVMIAAYLAAHELWSFYMLAVVFGTAYGGVMPLYALVTREYFGDKVMGTAYGAVFLISSLGMGVGSLAGGIIYDRLGAYAWLFLGSSLIAFAAVGLAFTFRRPSGFARATIAAASTAP
jgi:MFS family permease